MELLAFFEKRGQFERVFQLNALIVRLELFESIVCSERVTYISLVIPLVVGCLVLGWKGCDITTFGDLLMPLIDVGWVARPSTPGSG